MGSLRNLEPPTTGWLMPFTVPMEKTSSALVCKINARLARTAKALGNVNIDVPAKYLHRRRLHRRCHISMAGAKRFAQHLAPIVSETCG